MPSPKVTSITGSSRNATLTVYDLKSQCEAMAISILAKIAALEKKSFPATEVFDFSPAMLKKANTRVLYIVNQSVPLSVIAYCICVRHRRTLLFHKICVAELFRGQGVGRSLMREVMSRAAEENCLSLELWVDQSRMAARNLYVRFGLEEQCLVEDYYGPGRNGIKMSIQFAR